MVAKPPIEIGDLVRIHRDFRYTKPLSGSQHCSFGVGLVIDIGVHSVYKDSLSGSDKWLEYTILWSETGNKTKHFIGQLTKISGEDIWGE